MELLWGLLGFRVLVSPTVLLLFYYAGAIGMPLAAWRLVLRLRRGSPFLDRAMAAGARTLSALLRTPEGRRLAGLFLLALILMELFWRMLFEYLIAFLQMRDALLELNQSLRP